MTFSVVTPVLNDPRVGRAVDSILAQEYEPAPQVIVVDGGSTDETLDVLAAYGDRIEVTSEPDQGPFDAMNKGIRRARNDVVAILNADDRYVDPQVLRDVAGVVEGADACYANLVYTNRTGKVVRYWRAGRHLKAKWYFGWMPPHPTFFVRRRVYETHGMFDLRYPVAADYELMLRFVHKACIDVRYLDRVVVEMAVGGNSTRIIRGNVDVMQAWARNRLRGGLLAPILKPARKIWQLAVRPSPTLCVARSPANLLRSRRSVPIGPSPWRNPGAAIVTCAPTD